MATPGGLVDKQELIDAQLDTAHLGRVVNSKDASGNPISESTNRTGGVNKTLDALETEYLEAIRAAGGTPIGTWAAGVTTFNAYNEYAVYNGIPYKPRTSATLPYVAQGADPTVAPDDANVQPYTDVTREYVNDQDHESQEQLTGLKIFPDDISASAVIGQTVPLGTTAVRDGGDFYSLIPKPNFSGTETITALDFNIGAANIGGLSYRLVPYSEVDQGHEIGEVVSTETYTGQTADFKHSTLKIAITSAITLNGGCSFSNLVIYRKDQDGITNPIIISGQRNFIDGLDAKFVTRDFGQTVLLSDCEYFTLSNANFDQMGYQVLQQTGKFANSVRVLDCLSTAGKHDFFNSNNDSQAGISYDQNISNNIINHEGSVNPYGSTETRGIGFTTVYGGRAVNNSLLNVRGDAAAHCENVNDVVYGFNYFRDCWKDYLQSGESNRKWVRINTINGVDPIAIGDIITGTTSGATGTVLFWFPDSRLAWIISATGTWIKNEPYTVASKDTNGSIYFEDRVQSHVNKIGNIHHKTNTLTQGCNDYGSGNYVIRAHEVGESYIAQTPFGSGNYAVNAALAFDLNLSHACYRGFDSAIFGGTQMIQVSSRFTYSWGNLYHVNSQVATRCTFQGNTYWDGEFLVADSRQTLYEDLKFLTGSVINIDSTTRDNIWKYNIVSSDAVVTNLDVDDFVVWKSTSYDKEGKSHQLKLDDNILGAGEMLIATVTPNAPNTTCSVRWDISGRAGTTKGIDDGSAYVSWDASSIPTVTNNPSNWQVGALKIKLEVSGNNLLVKVEGTSGADNIYSGNVNINANGVTVAPVKYLDVA